MPSILGPGFALGVILAMASPALSSLRQGVPMAVDCSDGGGDEEIAAMDGVAGAAVARFLQRRHWECDVRCCLTRSRMRGEIDNDHQR